MTKEVGVYLQLAGKNLPGILSPIGIAIIRNIGPAVLLPVAAKGALSGVLQMHKAIVTAPAQRSRDMCILARDLLVGLASMHAQVITAPSISPAKTT